MIAVGRLRREGQERDRAASLSSCRSPVGFTADRREKKQVDARNDHVALAARCGYRFASCWSMDSSSSMGRPTTLLSLPWTM